MISFSQQNLTAGGFAARVGLEPIRTLTTSRESSMAHHPSSDTKKHDTVLFQMWEPFRQKMIEEQRFYLDQGKKKLLSQFHDMEKEAEQEAERWLEERAPYFDPDRDDPNTAYENAYQEGVGYYLLLSEMRDQTRLSLVAGMYHMWDKQLRSWLMKEIRHWHDGDTVKKKVWSATFDEISELLAATGLVKADNTYVARLSAFRYVVNVYKHGDGPAFERIKADHTEFLHQSAYQDIDPELLWIDFTSLTVSETQLDELSQAITDFWNGIPYEVRYSQVEEAPDWFTKAQTRDLTKK